MNARIIALLCVAACAPKIDPGAIPAERARAPVRLLELQEPGFHTVSFQATLAAGSARDRSGSEGLAHLTAAALVAGGAGERTADEVRAALASTGNAFEVVVDRELVSVRLRCPVEHQALCAELFTDALVRPRFEEAAVERLRENAIEQAGEGALADEEALGRRVLEAVIFEGHPYAHPVAGRTGALPTLGAGDVSRFHAAHYVREAMVVGLAGGYVPETVQAVRSALEGLPTARAPELVLLQPVPVQGRSLVVVETESEVTGFHLGHPLKVTRDHPDWPALHLALTALGAHGQSFGRLDQAIRADRGLNDGAYAYVEPYLERLDGSAPEQGLVRSQPHFSIGIRPTSLENGAFALKLALDELEHFVEEGLTEAELENARSYLLAQATLLAPDPGRRLAYALEAEAAGVPNLLELLPTVASLTLDQVHEAVRRHVRPDELRIVAVTGDPDGLRRALLEPGPTPVTYPLASGGDEAVGVVAKTVLQRDQEVAGKSAGLSPEDTWTVPARGIFR